MTSFSKHLVMKMTKKHEIGSSPTTVFWRYKWFSKKRLGVVNSILRQNTADIIVRIIENKALYNSFCEQPRGLVVRVSDY